MKRFLSLLLVLALLGGISASAAAEFYTEESDDVLPLGTASETGDLTILDPDAPSGAPQIYVRRAAMAAAEAGSALPASYDPREEGFLTAPRRQGNWNTCWAVAAMGAAETYGLKHGLLSTTVDDTDLSERHMVYFMCRQNDDPLGNSSNDYNSPASLSQWISDAGGNPVIATMTLASWHGPASEAATDSPYSGISTEDSLDPAYAYAAEMCLIGTEVMDIATAAQRNALKQELLEHGAAVLCMNFSASYLFVGSPTEASRPTPTPEPTPTPTPTSTPAPGEETTPAPETTAPPGGDAEPQSDAQPELIPVEPTPEAPAPETTPDEPTEPETDGAETAPEPEPSFSGLDGVPEPDGGDHADPAQEEDEAADDFTACYYQNASTGTNHEVLIVGWDDKYPAANFGYSSAGAKPSSDGAWLCRNSYGENFGEDGYFWVSYYDRCVSYNTQGYVSGRVALFDYASPDLYENCYEYDGAVVLGVSRATLGGVSMNPTPSDSTERRWYANVFTAATGQAERLAAVSTYTYYANVPYSIEVYTDLTDLSNPSSGTQAAVLTGTFDRAGFHTLSLDEAVLLLPGRTFSVCVCIGAGSDGSIRVPTCVTNTSSSTGTPWYSVNECLAGQSFLSVDGSSWTDCCTVSGKPNVRVKAYTDSIDSVAEVFSDVSVGTWFCADVQTLWLNGLMEGTGNGQFDPYGRTTRAQVIAVLRRAADGAPSGDAACSFDDVPEESWYYDDVRWAEEIGLVTGSDDDGDGVFSFRPSAEVTRQEFIVLLYRFAELMGADISAESDLTYFTDSDQLGDWSRGAISWSVGTGLLRGSRMPAGNYVIEPQSRMTRAQFCAFLNRYMNLL